MLGALVLPIVVSAEEDPTWGFPDRTASVYTGYLGLIIQISIILISVLLGGEVKLGQILQPSDRFFLALMDVIHMTRIPLVCTCCPGPQQSVMYVLVCLTPLVLSHSRPIPSPAPGVHPCFRLRRDMVLGPGCDVSQEYLHFERGA